MKKLIFATVSILFLANTSQAIVCTATAESMSPTNKLISKTQVLGLESEDAASIRFKADMGESYYFVQTNKIDNTYLLMITLGPEYTQGATASMTWDSENRMRLSRVDGYNVYKLSCEKK